MQRPLVSVLMTAYNRQKYIANAIDSVLASTLTDFELIITDDGSKDETLAIANKYRLADSRVKVFVNENNLGDYPNRNKAASYASGKYLKYVDADDYIYPWGLQILVEMMEQFPEAGWGLCSLDQFLEKPFPFLLSPAEAYLYNYKGPGLFHKAPLSSIIRKDVFEAIGGFNPIRMAGDFEMWHRLAQRYPVLLMPHGIVWYREHGEQEVNHYRQHIKIYEEIKIRYLRDENIPLDAATAGGLLKSEKKKILKNLLYALAMFRSYAVKDNFVRMTQYYVR
ncbi:glycosyltransferase family 2 protein [Pseudoflavitalea sp. X16]|uniref:glycosyltransferase family 2 protein n=1 Tax=Paraflavitalea devenefica TaxID=2716334 RepID=UPI001422230F|nr:glycosyltransferase family 2 protein [Paraflavitalea devenefica]NII24094.1 glycosyltransferase family 2 protein [Paraflavitalea devenefica]